MIAMMAMVSVMATMTVKVIVMILNGGGSDG